MSKEHQEANAIAAQLRSNGEAATRTAKHPELPQRTGRKQSQSLDTSEPVLQYMRDFFRRNDSLPALAQIAEHFGFSGASSAQWHQRRIERLGYIERNEVGRYRFATGPRK